MTLYKDRDHCFRCYRPQKNCLCSSIQELKTESTFVILMHPKEFRKTKNGTGRITHLSLPNSHLFTGIDFSAHEGLNTLLDDPLYAPFLLYPGDEAINLSTQTLALNQGKKPLFILIDSTWACSKKMIRLSRNLHRLPTLSFDTTKLSNFTIKEQPNEACLSTIETTHKILTLLNQHNVEQLQDDAIDTLLRPFETMISYQVNAAQNSQVRYKAPTKH